MRPEFESIQTELDRIRSLPDEMLLAESLKHLQQGDKSFIHDWQAELDARVSRFNADFSERVHNGLDSTITIEEVRLRQDLWETNERYKMVIDPDYGRIQFIGRG